MLLSDDVVAKFNDNELFLFSSSKDNFQFRVRISFSVNATMMTELILIDPYAWDKKAFQTESLL